MFSWIKMGNTNKTSILAVVVVCMANSTMAGSWHPSPPPPDPSTDSSKITSWAVPINPDTGATVGIFNSTYHWIKYFIPLDEDHYTDGLGNNDPGIYGVTDVTGNGDLAGTFSDYGNGEPFPFPSGDLDVPTALQMFLRFDDAHVPAETAMLTFHFKDLDLELVNDPSEFFESIQFLTGETDGNGDTTYTKLTEHIFSSSDDGSTGVLPFEIQNADTTSLDIVFPDVTSIVQAPFFVQLNFTSYYNQTKNASNTAEKLKANLMTTPKPPEILIPVPSAAWVGLIGFSLIAQMRRTRRREG